MSYDIARLLNVNVLNAGFHSSHIRQNVSPLGVKLCFYVIRQFLIVACLQHVHGGVKTLHSLHLTFGLLCSIFVDKNFALHIIIIICLSLPGCTKENKG